MRLTRGTSRRISIKDKSTCSYPASERARALREDSVRPTEQFCESYPPALPHQSGTATAPEAKKAAKMAAHLAKECTIWRETADVRTAC